MLIGVQATHIPVLQRNFGVGGVGGVGRVGLISRGGPRISFRKSLDWEGSGATGDPHDRVIDTLTASLLPVP